MVLPSGDVRWITSLGEVEVSRDGAPIRMAGIHLDITERKTAELALRKSEEALRQSRALLRQAADAAGLTLSVSDMRTGLNHAADNYSHVMGFRAAGAGAPAALANAARHLGRHVPEDDRAPVLEAIAALRNGCTTATAEYRVIGDDGVERWIESRGDVELGDDGRPDRIFFTHLDVTARVAARKALEAAHGEASDILASIADGFYAVNANWRIVYFNAFAEQYSSRRREDVIGRSLFEVYPETEYASIMTRFQRVMTERAPLQFEVLSPFTQRWFFFAVYPRRDGGISVYFRNVSEQKRMESEIKSARIDAERANRAKSKFLAAASHDLRQPVQSLVLLMALAERQIAAHPAALATLHLMQRSLEGLNGLLNAILDISRLEAGVDAATDGGRSRRPALPARRRIRAEGAGAEPRA